MNINFLNERLAIRHKEIENNQNLGTRDPLYFVYSMRDVYLDGHCKDRSPITNLRNWEHENLYLKKEYEEDAEVFEEIPENENKDDYDEITRVWLDEFKAIFLTREAAKDYLKYQAHNLKRPYIYVHHAGYRNWEFDNLEIDKKS